MRDPVAQKYFNPAEEANFLAAKAVAHATAFLDGRNDAAELARNADRIQLELLVANEPATNVILDPVRLLNFAMMRTAVASREARADRWRQVGIPCQIGAARSDRAARHGRTTLMRPLSQTLTDLIGFAEVTLTRPRRYFDVREDERFAALAAEVRRADALPAESIRTTRAAVIMVTAIEEFHAGDREPTSQWLGLAGTALPLLRAEAWRARRNEEEARGQ